MVIDTYRGVDNYVCWCHNSPLYVMYGKAKAIRSECPVELDWEEIQTLRHTDLRNDRWYMSRGGWLLENQSVWAPDVLPPYVSRGRGERVADEDLTFFIHMYIRVIREVPLERMLSGVADASTFFSSSKQLIVLRRSLIQPFGLDDEGSQVNQIHAFNVKNKGTSSRQMFQYVKTWTGYVPLPVEVHKAKTDWLARQADRDYIETVAVHSGINPGVITQ